MSRRFRVGLFAGVVVAMTVLAHPTSSAASRLGVFGSELVYVADPGEVRDVAIDVGGALFTVTDAPGRTIRILTLGCLTVANTATCSTAGVTSLLVVGGSGDDTITGGPGDDVP